MTNPSSSINKGVCRRSLLKSVPLIAGAIISTNAVAQNLFAQAKVTHEAAKYQDHPNNGQQCSNCVQFVTITGVLAGPFWARPTKAATAVPTPSIGREAAWTSST